MRRNRFVTQTVLRSFFFLSLLFIYPLIAASVGGTKGNGGAFVKDRFRSEAEHLYRYWANQIMGRYWMYPDRPWYIFARGELIPFDLIPFVYAQANIEVTAKELYDVHQSKVAAKVEKQSPVNPLILMVQLDENLWAPHLSNESEFRKMVCHEIMRSLRLDDDDNRYCGYLMEIYEADFSNDETGKARAVMNETFKKTNPRSKKIFVNHEQWLLQNNKQKINETLSLDGLNVGQEVDLSADSVSPILLPEKPKTKFTVVDYSQSRAVPEEVGPLEILVTESHYSIRDYYGKNLFEAKYSTFMSSEYYNLNIHQLTPEENKRIWSYYRSTLPENNSNFSHFLNDAEKTCLEDQVNILNSLRDASNQEEVSLRFRKVMKLGKVEFFNIALMKYSTQEISSFDSILLEDNEKRSLEILKRAKPYISLTVGPKALDLASNEERALKFTINLLMPDGKCSGPVNAPSLLKHLSEAVRKTLVSE